MIFSFRKKKGGGGRFYSRTFRERDKGKFFLFLTVKDFLTFRVGGSSIYLVFFLFFIFSVCVFGRGKPPPPPPFFLKDSPFFFGVLVVRLSLGVIPIASPSSYRPLSVLTFFLSCAACGDGSCFFSTCRPRALPSLLFPFVVALPLFCN